ncbi:MAG: hypothetical protein SF052_08930 [Bacteroidia bacterium]|nr:hypothetical protein [Bacteroidia bacterium]
MNKTLVLYFDDTCVIGAVEPFDGKFTRLEKNGKDRFSLFFYLDGGRVNYGQAYQADADRGDVKAIGNFYTKVAEGGNFDFSGYSRAYVELLDSIVEDIRESYFKVFSGISNAEQELNISDAIPLKTAFSPNIPAAAQTAILAYLEQKEFERDSIALTPSFSNLILLHKLNRRELKIPGVYAVVEGLNEDLNVCLIQVQQNHATQTLVHQTYPGFGTDPRVGVISRFVVDKADESLHVLYNQADREAEYKFKFRQAIEWNDQLLKSRRPFIYVKLTLSPAPNSELTVSVIQKEIEGLTMIRSQQVARYAEHTITPHLPMADLTGIVIFGDSLKNSQVLEGFYRFGKEKLIVHGDDQLFDVLKGLLVNSAEDLPDSSASITETPKTPSAPKTISLQNIRAVDLKTGDRVEFTWEPGRMVVAEHQGSGRFRIVYHENSSVVTGDTFVADMFSVGQKGFLKNVVRPSSGQVLGNYNSGLIKTLNRITSG